MIIILKHPGFYLALIGVIIALILMRIVFSSPPPSEPYVPPAVNPYIDTVAASGIIEAVDKNIFIGAPEEGIVTLVFVNVSDQVKKGQPLFQIDDRPLLAQLKVQETQLKVSEASLIRLQDQLGRLKSVKDSRAVSQEEIKTKENDVAVSAAEVEVAKANIEQTKTLIHRMTVRAPQEGIILQNNIRKGEYLTKTTTAMLLGNLQHLQVRADVDEQNASQVNPEAPAMAFPKNNTTLAIPLTFSRLEPYVIPKKSLTGDTTERVDTRVLQIIYSFEMPKDFHLYVGQQVDVFIKKKGSKE